ncbi:MAG: glycine dehydrogenase (aminomethyl-transferring), partial [Alcanivorax sp.]|nr:glycine dehydrogenase (aminomethyl-transferring) [Alcanivorax sp.]
TGPVFPQTLALLKSRAEPLQIIVECLDPSREELPEDAFGLLVQYPDADGAVRPLGPLLAQAQEQGIMTSVATDLLALTLLTPPGQFGADVVVGSSQRFGVPMGYGGPHAAFFAMKEQWVREAPGRIIGVSVDRRGNRVYRMALQTREQHIRREKAKSNICTAQALLASMAGMYAVYHGPEGLRAIARRVHGLTAELNRLLAELGASSCNQAFFDTLTLEFPDAATVDRLVQLALEQGINLYRASGNRVGISLDETTDEQTVMDLATLVAGALGVESGPIELQVASDFPDGLAECLRQEPILQHPVFNRYHSETEMMRYLKRLERKDVGLDTAMIP